MAEQSLHAARTYSLRGRLLWLLLVAVALAALVQGAVTYYTASSEADEIFDYHMQQTAMALRGGLPFDTSSRSVESDVEEANFDFVVQIWTADGTPLFASTKRAPLPRQTVPGFSELAARGTQYRVFSMQTPMRIIQVAQDVAVRRELAGSLVLRVVAPVMLLAPLLMLAVWWVVTQSTRPLARARLQIARRAADELSPLIAPGLPDEVRPLVDEINLLFARLVEAFDAQRSFVADAAHELRSPLAALRLQVQSMQRATDVESRTVAARRALSGLDRAGRLVDQLLLLARQDAAAELTGGTPIDVRAMITLAISDVLPAAQERRIDLGIVDAEPASVNGDEDALRILFRNLLENAIKYSPLGGTVDINIRTQSGDTVVEIGDSGPGIPQEERDRAFDRFYRAAGSAAAGSGLGLAIAQRIAHRHHASITLDTSSRLGGLLVTVRFSESEIKLKPQPLAVPR